MSTTGYAYAVQLAVQNRELFSAIALARKLVLLTRNHRDLGKVPGLLIEDWTV
jgi:tRNA(fMet)-specific endonuclease VapC